MFRTLHERWTKYISDLVSNQTGVEDRLLTADLHGCLICIESAKQAALSGKQGIVIQSKLHTFTIIGRDQSVLTVPKAGSIFSYRYMPQRKVTLNGSRLSSFGM